MFREKGNVSVLLVLLIILTIGGGIYFLGNRNNKSTPSQNVDFKYQITPTLTPTPTNSPFQISNIGESRKGYVNNDLITDYRFSFSYPEEWDYKDEFREKEIMTMGEKLPNSEHIVPRITIRKHSFYPGTPIERGISFPEETKMVWSDKTFGDVKTKQVLHNNCSTGDCLNYFINKSNVWIDFSIEEASNKDLVEILTQIISTFKFINK